MLVQLCGKFRRSILFWWFNTKNAWYEWTSAHDLLMFTEREGAAETVEVEKLCISSFKDVGISKQWTNYDEFT